MAGVALGDMDCHFAWQAWHLMHWAGTDDALGSGWVAAGLRLVAAHFAWQAWHLMHWIVHFAWLGVALNALGWN